MPCRNAFVLMKPPQLIGVLAMDGLDRRSKRVQLTDRGHALRHKIRATVSDIEQELEQQLGAASYAQLRELLVQLNACTIAAARPAHA